MVEKKKDITLREREFDGRYNFPADDEVECLLEEHFEKYNLSGLEICKNFQIYTRRIFLKRFGRLLSLAESPCLMSMASDLGKGKAKLSMNILRIRKL